MQDRIPLGWEKIIGKKAVEIDQTNEKEISLLWQKIYEKQLKKL